MYLFLRLFKCLYEPDYPARGKGLTSYNSSIHGSKPLLEFSSFLDWFFLVTPVSPGDHASIYDVHNRVEGRCNYLYPKYWNGGYFLLEDNMFTYSEKEVSRVPMFKRSVSKFINNMAYIGGAISVTQDDNKCLKCLIDIPLVVKVRSREERRTIFGKFFKLFLFLWYFSLNAYDIYFLLIFCAECMGNEEQFKLLRQWVWPTRNNVIAENLHVSSNAPGRTARPLLTGSGSRSIELRQLPSPWDNCAYLDDLSWPVLEEEMGNLAKHARRALAALALGASGN